MIQDILKLYPIVNHNCHDIQRLFIGSSIIGYNSVMIMNSIRAANHQWRKCAVYVFVSFAVWIIAGIITQPFATLCGMATGSQYRYGVVDTLPYVIVFAITGQVTGLLSVIVATLIEAGFSANSDDSAESTGNDESDDGKDSAENDENAESTDNDEDTDNDKNTKNTNISAMLDEESIKKLDEVDQPVIHELDVGL